MGPRLNRNQAASVRPGLSGGTAIASYVYDASGNITSRALDNGTSTAYTVDTVNRDSVVLATMVGSTKRFDYAYNTVNDITAVQRDSSLGDGYSYDLTQQTTEYRQNGAVNLGTGTVTGGTDNTLAFDGCGNRTVLNAVPQTYNNMNQPTGGTFNYDNEGCLLAYNGWIYIYDAQNRLTNATNGTTTAQFYYDGKNRQIARSINGAVTFSVWDDWELIEEYGTGNVRTAAYLQGAHGPVKSLLNNIYFYQDELGSTSHIADATGHLLEYYKYNLYGAPTYWSATNTQLTASAYNIRDLFSGERYIPELGLYDDRNRFMSPDLGRFLQPDPIGFKGDASNLYRYCGNDWANKSDPNGIAPVVLDSDTERLAQVAAMQNYRSWQNESVPFFKYYFWNMMQKSEFGTTVWKDKQTQQKSLSATTTNHSSAMMIPSRDPSKAPLVDTHNHPNNDVDKITNSVVSQGDIRHANLTGVTTQVITPNGTQDRFRPSEAQTLDQRVEEGGVIERRNSAGQWVQVPGSHTTGFFADPRNYSTKASNSVTPAFVPPSAATVDAILQATGVGVLGPGVFSGPPVPSPLP